MWKNQIEIHTKYMALSKYFVWHPSFFTQKFSYAHWAYENINLSPLDDFWKMRFKLAYIMAFIIIGLKSNKCQRVYVSTLHCIIWRKGFVPSIYSLAVCRRMSCHIVTFDCCCCFYLAVADNIKYKRKSKRDSYWIDAKISCEDVRKNFKRRWNELKAIRSDERLT